MSTSPEEVAMKSETPELLPCPFCLWPVRAVEIATAGYSLVGCNNRECPASDISCYPERWNTRAKGDIQERARRVAEEIIAELVPYPPPYSRNKREKIASVIIKKFE